MRVNSKRDMMELIMKTREKLSVSVVFRPEPEGGFTVLVPALVGCVTYGKTLSKAKKAAREAIELYLESMNAAREPLPIQFDAYSSSLEVTLPAGVHVQNVHA